jgi:hypothetical protein
MVPRLVDKVNLMSASPAPLIFARTSTLPWPNGAPVNVPR